jgi:hypothetical protein
LPASSPVARSFWSISSAIAWPSVLSSPIREGGTIFIPKTAWYGFLNPDHELLLLWIVTPPGLDGFFRETCNPPGVPRKQLTKDQINEIARKYATEFR